MIKIRRIIEKLPKVVKINVIKKIKIVVTINF